MRSEIPEPDRPTNQVKRPCCPTCLNYTPGFIEPDWNKSDKGLWSSSREPLVSEFKNSAARCCELCSIVYRGLLKTIPDALTDNSMTRLSVWRRMLGASVFKRDAGYKQSHFIRFHAMPGHHHRWCTLETVEALSRSLRDKRCFDRIGKWLNIYYRPMCYDPSDIRPRKKVHKQGQVTATKENEDTATSISIAGIFPGVDGR